MEIKNDFFIRYTNVDYFPVDKELKKAKQWYFKSGLRSYLESPYQNIKDDLEDKMQEKFLDEEHCVKYLLLLNCVKKAYEENIQSAFDKFKKL